MRIALVVPNVARHLHAETFEPLGVLYLAALARSEHDVCIIDAFNRDLGLEEAWAELLVFRPDLVGLSLTMSPTAPFARALARRVKQWDSRTVVIAGGTHATFCATELAARDEIDAVVLHDGEGAFAEILAGRPLTDVAGLVLRVDGLVVETPARPLPAELESLPFPARDLLPSPEIYQRRHVLSSRGCVFRCVYCAASVMQKFRWRSRGATNVVNEIVEIAELGFPRFYFADDNFTVNRRRVLEICAELTRRCPEAHWSCLSRVEFIRDEKLLRAMAAAGCDQIFIGVESGSDTVLAQMERHYTAADVTQVVDRCRSAGIEVTASFIVGNPFETETDVRASFELARRIDTPNVAFHIFTPYVGTPAWTDPGALGLDILTTDPEIFDKNREPVSQTNHLSRTRIMELYCESFGISLEKARQRLWSRPS